MAAESCHAGEAPRASEESGLDTQSRVFEDLVGVGIIVSTMAVRTALEDASL